MWQSSACIPWFAVLCAVVVSTGCQPRPEPVGENRDNGAQGGHNAPDNGPGGEPAGQPDLRSRIVGSWNGLRLDSIDQRTGEPSGWGLIEFSVSAGGDHRVRYSFRYDSTEPGDSRVTWAEDGELDLTGTPGLVREDTQYESGPTSARRNTSVTDGRISFRVRGDGGELDEWLALPPQCSPCSMASLLIAVAALDSAEGDEWKYVQASSDLYSANLATCVVRLEDREDRTLGEAALHRFGIRSDGGQVRWTVWIDPTTLAPVRIAGLGASFAVLKVAPDKLPGGPASVFTSMKAGAIAGDVARVLECVAPAARHQQAAVIVKAVHEWFRNRAGDDGAPEDQQAAVRQLAGLAAVCARNGAEIAGFKPDAQYDVTAMMFAVMGAPDPLALCRDVGTWVREHEPGALAAVLAWCQQYRAATAICVKAVGTRGMVRIRTGKGEDADVLDLSFARMDGSWFYCP